MRLPPDARREIAFSRGTPPHTAAAAKLAQEAAPPRTRDSRRRDVWCLVEATHT